MSRRRRNGTWRGRLLEILLVGCAVLALIAFNEPISRWAGQYIAGAFDRSMPAGSSPSETPTPRGTGLTLDEAVEIARAAAPDRTPISRAYGERLQYGQLAEQHGIPSLNPPPPTDTWVWLINLSEGPQSRGTFVVIDLLDGTVLQVTHWIA
jgi:hypothetical protein